MIAEVKRGHDDVVVPGEAGAAAATRAAGAVTVPAATWSRLVALAQDHGIDIPPIEEDR